MKYLSKFKALKDNYGEYTAAMWLENKMKNNTISSWKQNSIYNI